MIQESSLSLVKMICDLESPIYNYDIVKNEDVQSIFLRIVKVSLRNNKETIRTSSIGSLFEL